MNYIILIMPSLLSGAKMTLILFLWTLIISIPLGIIVSLGLISHFKILYLDYAWYTIVTTINLYFLWATIIGIIFQRYNAALFAFILNYTAYFAEIFRSGFQSVPIGQYESAYVLQLTKWQTLRHIIIPQVSKIVIPSIGNEVINLVKDTSLVYVIGLGELLRAGNVATARDVTLVPLVLVGIIYLLMTGIASFILKKIEHSYSKWK